MLKNRIESLEIAILPTDQLRPHEKGSPLYLKLLKREILGDGVLRYPIVADEKTHVILDGMHRWLAIRSFGYELIPVMLVDVFRNPKIRVGKRRIQQYTGCADEEISVEKVISAGLQGHLLEPRTTRHFFPFSKLQRIDYPLHLLRKNVPQDVSRYLSTMSNEECSSAIGQWLAEICEELAFLSKRKDEVEREKEEFLNRVKNLGNGL